MNPIIASTVEVRREDVDSSRPVPDMKTLRARIPAHCFERNLWTSMQYVIRDLMLVAALGYAGLQVTSMTDSPVTCATLWILYGFMQGLVFTGLWILAHECGHDAFSDHPMINTTVGFSLHSLLLVPYFSWKYSHSRHHRFANHMDKDTVFVPPRKSEYRQTWWTGSFLGHAEDAPLVNIVLLLGHQLLGWIVYIVFNAGAGTQSLIGRTRLESYRQSHLDPRADIFSPREHPYILISNLGLAMTAFGLWGLSRWVGVVNMCLLYVVPYLWMNHWLVAITYLHHTHPEAAHYDSSSWSFQNGALSTIDRDFGFIGRHLFHGIIEYHVVHHMFPRIPFYHAQEASEAIAPLLGKAYLRQTSPFLRDLWTTFTTCRFVEESTIKRGRLYWTTTSH